MEFIDIKVFRSTGESQGVAFVKFESEAQAFGASRELHQTELPTGSGRFLQAIVIQDPSLFSTIHGASHAMLPGEHGGNVSRGGGSDDVDLSAVEAKFAHLMRSNDHSSAFTAAPGQHRLSIDEPSPAGTTALQYPALTYYPGPAGSYSAAPLYPMQMQVQPHQAPQVYGYYPQHQPQYHQHLVSNQLGQQQYAYVPALWPTETSSPASYYQSMHPLSGYASAAPMAFPSPPEYYNQPVYPAQVTYPVPVAVSGEENSVAMMAVDTESPPTTGGSSDSSDGARPTPPAIYISGGRSLDLVTVVKALEDCNGVVAITKDGEDNDAAFVVEFADSTQAADAVKTLDGMMCSGKKLRAATMSPGIGGVKQRAGTSRRKRQRVDPRTRK
ncbi:Rrm domain containing protein [Globisporangium polare]